MTRKAVDLFCGSGGVTVGLKRAGWSVLAAVDIDPVASKTYKMNHPEVTFLEADIRAPSTTGRLIEAVSGQKIDLVVICAPCQPFSSQNRKRGSDVREELIIESLDAIRGIRPRLVFFENVPGLAGPRYQDLLMRLRQNLKSLGFWFSEPKIEDASTFGVPQRRKRFTMLASATEKGLNAFLSTSMALRKQTVRDCIGDLPVLGSGDRDPLDPLHKARRHSAIALERLRSISTDGGSRCELPERLELRCHAGKSAFPDVYGRMKWGDVAPTLTTGCTDVTRGRFAHPAQDRAMTLREAARLQTFSDSYRFHGSDSEIASQIGNAVPPAMIASLATGFEAALAS